jgi:hypothetical protein
MHSSSLEEPGEVVRPQGRRVDQVCTKDLVHPGRLDLGVLLQPGQVDARGVAANDPVRLGRDGGLVDDAVAAASVDAVGLAPRLREDVVDVDSLVEVGLGVDGVARPEVQAAVDPGQHLGQVFGEARLGGAAVTPEQVVCLPVCRCRWN